MNGIAMTANQLPLHDIVVESTISWWPLAIGWWLLIGASILLLSISGWWLWRHWRYRRGVQRIEQRLQAPVERLSDVSLRLQQVLLLKHSRDQLNQSYTALLLDYVPASQRDSLQRTLSSYLEQQFQPHQQAHAEAFQQWAIVWWQAAYPQFKQEARHV